MAACGTTANAIEAKEAEPQLTGKLSTYVSQANPIVTFQCLMNDDIRAYCKSKGITMDPADFVQFRAELYLDKMPYTVSNFVDLVQKGFYDGIYFHRIIKNFMLQFGCPNTKSYTGKGALPKTSGQGNPKAKSKFKILAGRNKGKEGQRSAPNMSTGDYFGGCIQDEHTQRMSNKPFTLSMANTGSVNSGGSQFFINTADNAYLDWFTPGKSKHPVFGKILDSDQAYVKLIENVRTNEPGQPISPLKMKKVFVSGV